jgi:hypothetical protein
MCIYFLVHLSEDQLANPYHMKHGHPWIPHQFHSKDHPKVGQSGVLCNPSTQDAEAGDGEFKASLCYKALCETMSQKHKKRFSR